MKHRKIHQGDRLLAVLFIGCLAFLSSSRLLTKDRKISDNENRALTQRPVWTMESVMAGSYEDKLEKYLSDQMPFREQFMTVNVLLKQLGGSRKENGVLFGKNGELFKEILRPDEQRIEENIAAINRLADENAVTVYFLLVPDKSEIYPSLLPDFAVTESEKKHFDEIHTALSEQVQWLDGLTVMKKHKDQRIYYKTDHHWTSYGAFQMFLEMAGQLGVEETQSVEYEAFPVTDDFRGVLSRNSGFEAKVREEIEVYLPKEEVEVVVNYVDERKKRSSLFDTEKLETADKYAVFLGGNSSLIDIRTTAASNQTIMVIKDSFANSFIPFLVPYYKEIVVVDPRYYAGTVQELLKQYGVNEILFLYSGGTFLEDNHLAGFLGSGS